LKDKRWRYEDFQFVELEETYIDTTPRFGKRPDMPWEYVLFCKGYRVDPKRKGGRSLPIRFLHELKADTREEIDELLLEFVTRPNVTLLEDTHEETAIA